jgi:hypothetical protein
MMMKTRIPDRPSISDVLIKASANIAFRTKLLDSPKEIVAEMNLTPEDAAILTGVQAPNLKEYVNQVKTKLMSSYA